MSYCAFFDLDETIINCKSMLEVMKYYFSKHAGSYDKFYKMLMAFHHEHNDRYKTNRYFYQLLEGIDAENMKFNCQQWFFENKNQLFNQAILKALHFHQKNGAIVMIVSGSFEEAVKPIADHLGVQIFICNRLERSNEKFTGNLLNEPMIGQGKANGINAVVSSHHLNFQGSYAYGDHISDLPMLLLAEYPIVTGHCDELRAYAEDHNWPVV